MEKTLTICGRDVTFKATGGLPYRYKSQFGREYIQDMLMIEQSISGIKAPSKNSSKTAVEEYELKTAYTLTSTAIEMMYNILWCMAKTADDSIPDPQRWLDSFDAFPVFEIWPQLEDIISANMEIAPKNA